MKVKITDSFSIDLPDDIHGLLAWRSFKLDQKTGLLKSIVTDYTWDIVNDNLEPPVLDNRENSYAQSSQVAQKFSWQTLRYPQIKSLKNEGFYARKLEAPEFALEDDGIGIWGLVELRGKIYEHDDGCLRAQWARILNLFLCLDELSYNNLELSSKYQGVLKYKISYDEVDKVADGLRKIYKQKDILPFMISNSIKEITSPPKKDPDWVPSNTVTQSGLNYMVKVASQNSQGMASFFSGNTFTLSSLNMAQIVNIDVKELEEKIYEKVNEVRASGIRDFKIVLSREQTKAIEYFYEHNPYNNLPSAVTFIQTLSGYSGITNFMGYPVIVTSLHDDKTPFIV